MTDRRDAVKNALDRAAQAVLSMQREDGGFVGQNHSGPFATAMDLTLERYVGTLDEHVAREAVRYLRSTQLADGSVPQWSFAKTGTPFATAGWYAGMHSAGVSSSDPAMERAWRFLENNGGVGALDVLNKTMLAAAGVVSPSELPWVPLAYNLVPFHEYLLSRVFGLNALIPLYYLPAFIRGIKRGKRPASWWCHPIQAAEDAAVLQYFTERQDPSGGWIGVPFITQSIAAMMVSLGVSPSDSRVQRAMAWARKARITNEHGLEMMPFESALWDTCQCVRGLLKAGVPASDPKLRKAIDFLVQYQTRLPSPRDWQTPPRGAPPDRGWPFEIGNERNPDLDSTQQVLSALALFAKELPHREGPLDDAITSARDWLLAMQNPDGGWGAFSYGKPTMPPGPLYPYQPKNPATDVGLLSRLSLKVQQTILQLGQVGDPSAADVTARMLYTLGVLGMDERSVPVRKAMDFLSWQRDPGSGVWWGLWAVNYIPATVYALTGAAKVNALSSLAGRDFAIEWLLSRQNADGGWGETERSYDDPWLAGRGDTSSWLTAAGIWGLCAAGKRELPAVDRAVDRLLAMQQPDGFWRDEVNQGTMAPKQGYYWNTTFATYFAMEALGSWL